MFKGTFFHIIHKVFLDIVLPFCTHRFDKKEHKIFFSPAFPLPRDTYINYEVMQIIFFNSVISIISNSNYDNLSHGEKRLCFFSSTNLYSALSLKMNTRPISIQPLSCNHRYKETSDLDLSKVNRIRTWV